MSAPTRILVPVDGSDASLRAVDHAIALVRRGLAPGVHLLNVQPPVRGVGSFVSKSDLDTYHRDEGLKVLVPAVERLEAAGIDFDRHIAVGDPGPTVAGFVTTLGAEHVVMGTHGRRAVTEMFLGSVARHVIGHCAVPVTLLR